MRGLAGGGGGVSQQGGYQRHQGPRGGLRGPAHQDMQVRHQCTESCMDSVCL